MKPRTLISLALVALWLLSSLLLKSGGAFPAQSIAGLASPYLFNLPRWEATKLWDELARRLPLAGRDASPGLDLTLVESYFKLGREMEALGQRPGGAAARPIETKRQALRQEREALEARVKATLARQIGQVLAEEGISRLPPILFTFDTLPQVLVVSPRERIELQQVLLLEPGLSPPKAAELERGVEALPPPKGQGWGVSALVEELGGLAVYPSLVPETASLEGAITTTAHEWVHQYLFFRPLGRRYRASYEMTTINETVADIVAQEIGDRVLRLYGKRRVKRPEVGPSGFDFNREMRQTRLQVDELLTKGQVREAESYMEARRQFLAGHGYRLRRLNQAYFAFHGSYGESPASTSPVASWLHALRRRSPSLGQFLRQVAQITSYRELERLASP